MARLAALTADTRLLDDLSHGRRQMPIISAGLFAFQEPPDEISTQLRNRVIDAYGEDYLISAIKTLDRDLANIPITAPNIDNLKITNDAYPAPVSSLSQKYGENRLKRVALSVLNRGIPIRKVELMDMDHFRHPGDPKGLTQNERNKLSAYAETLKASIIHLVSSSRPDWGYPLLLAAARYQAVMGSLKRNRLLLLDPFPQAAKSVPAKTVQGNPTVTAQLADRAWRTYWNIRRNTFSEKFVEERTYNGLEESAGRFAELEKGRKTGKAIRVAYGRLIPSRTGMAPLATPTVSQQTINTSLNSARLNRDTYDNKLKHCYPYHLITHNCATELMRNLNASFQSETRITAPWGETLRREKISVSSLSTCLTL